MNTRPVKAYRVRRGAGVNSQPVSAYRVQEGRRELKACEAYRAQDEASVNSKACKAYRVQEGRRELKARGPPGEATARLDRVPGNAPDRPPGPGANLAR